MKKGVEALLEAELDEELGCDKYGNTSDKSNHRNGSSKKTVRTDLGEINLKIPRDRNNDFEPEIVPNHYKDLSAIEDKSLSMYGEGMTTRDISEHIEDIYCIHLSAQSISRMADKVLPVIEEWQQRPINIEYSLVLIISWFFLELYTKDVTLSSNALINASTTSVSN